MDSERRVTDMDVTDPYLTILMPAYNDAACLSTTIPLVAEYLERLSVTYEILVINDGSRDSTVEVVQGLMPQNRAIRLFSHRQNLGPGSGIYTGLAVSRGEFVLFLPADLAMDPADLPKVVAACSHTDVVVGIRSDRRDYSMLRKVVSVVNIHLIRVLFGMRLKQYNYIQAYRRAMFDRFYPHCMGAFIAAEILIRARDAGYRLTEVPLRYKPREVGRTHVARPGVISRTMRDMLTFWVRWMWRRGSSSPLDTDGSVQSFVDREVLTLLREEPASCATA